MKKSKKVKIIVCVSLLVFLGVFLLVMYLVFFKNPDIQYNLNPDGQSYCVYQIYSEDEDIVIDSTYKDLPVTTLRSSLFNVSSAKKTIKSITIPDSITTIEEDAFSGCTSLTTITIGSNVTSIGSGVFKDTAWYNNSSNWNQGSLYLGNYLLKVDSNNLSTYSVKEGTTVIADEALSGNENLTSVIMPSSVVTIGNEAFYNCSSLTSISLPNNLTSIGDSAFNGCTVLSNISGGDKLTSVGISSFYNTAWWNNDNNWTSDGMLYLGKCLIRVDDEITYCSIEDGTKVIAGSAFSYCKSLSSVTIPDSVVYVGGSAFYFCSSLVSITIPESVTAIYDETFEGCSSLTDITLSESLTYIGTEAFRRCSSLTSITIPQNVTYIEGGAFWNCDSLTSATFENTKNWRSARDGKMSKSKMSNAATMAEFLRENDVNLYVKN